MDHLKGAGHSDANYDGLEIENVVMVNVNDDENITSSNGQYTFYSSDDYIYDSVNDLSSHINSMEPLPYSGQICRPGYFTVGQQHLTPISDKNSFFTHLSNLENLQQDVYFWTGSWSGMCLILTQLGGPTQTDCDFENSLNFSMCRKSRHN